MSLYELKTSLETTPWLILPSYAVSLKAKIDDYLAGKLTLEIEDEDEPTEKPEEKEEVSNIINVSGAITKRVGLPEDICELLGICDLDYLTEKLKALRDDENTKDIIMVFNSPGGNVIGLQECAELISDIASKKNVICYTDYMCCSAAYWLASQGGSFYCSPSSVVGSIGARTTIVNYSKALDEQGVQVDVITSGKYKALGDPYGKPITDEEKKYLQDDINKCAEKFKSAVLSKRCINPEYMQGQVFDGDEAVRLGLADGLINDIEDLLYQMSK